MTAYSNKIIFLQPMTDVGNITIQVTAQMLSIIDSIWVMTHTAFENIDSNQTMTQMGHYSNLIN